MRTDAAPTTKSPATEPRSRAELLFSRDDRPADGWLEELVVARNGEGLFDATLRTAFFDRINGDEIDKIAEIGAGLARQ